MRNKTVQIDEHVQKWQRLGANSPLILCLLPALNDCNLSRILLPLNLYHTLASLYSYLSILLLPAILLDVNL